VDFDPELQRRQPTNANVNGTNFGTGAALDGGSAPQGATGGAPAYPTGPSYAGSPMVAPGGFAPMPATPPATGGGTSMPAPGPSPLPPPADQDAGVSAPPAAGDENQNPCFEYLGDGLRCEDAEAHAQSANLEKVVANTLAECQAVCETRPDCIAVSDYFDESPYPVCYYQQGPCGTPSSSGGWQEEDAGKEYSKVCDGDGGTCSFEYLGNWMRCEEALRGAVTVVAGGFEACKAACLADPNCTTVTDYHYLSDVPGCYLYTAQTCDAPEALPFGDSGKAYRRVCKPDLDGGP